MAFLKWSLVTCYSILFLMFGIGYFTMKKTSDIRGYLLAMYITAATVFYIVVT